MFHYRQGLGRPPPGRGRGVEPSRENSQNFGRRARGFTQKRDGPQFRERGPPGRVSARGGAGDALGPGEGGELALGEDGGGVVVAVRDLFFERVEVEGKANDEARRGGRKVVRFPSASLRFSFSLSVQLFSFLFPSTTMYVHPRDARRKHRAERRHGENQKGAFRLMASDGRLEGEAKIRRSGDSASVSTRELSLSNRAELVDAVGWISRVARVRRT